MVTVGEAWIPPPDPMVLRCDQACPHSADQLYSEGRMFHGPRFQVVSALCGMSEEAIAAELVIRDPQELFATPLGAQLIFDPVLLDGLGQVLGYRAQLDEQAVYPVGIGRVAFHGLAPPPGSTVRTAIRFRRLDARRLEADIDVFDAGGRLWLHIDGWQTWRLLVPKHLQEFAWRPEARSLAAPWPLGGSRASCFRIARHLLGEVDLDRSARMYLAGEEWIRYQQRPRLDWLLGRIAANDAIRDWLRRQHGRILHPLEVTIANRPGGAPIVVAPADVPLAISISHLDEEAIAVVADAQGVGVDVARVGERGAEGLDLAFDQEERAAIAGPGGNAQTWVHRAWCAKEAAAKAHGLGFDALGRFRVRRIAGEDGTVQVIRDIPSLEWDVEIVDSPLTPTARMAPSSMKFSLSRSLWHGLSGVSRADKADSICRMKSRSDARSSGKELTPACRAFRRYSSTARKGENRPGNSFPS
jgi:phosphopantetheinyl transferase